MDVGVEAQLRVGEVTVDATDAALLRAIADRGSILAAAESLGRSRARAQTRVDALEAELGSLVERTRGGADGGGSRLTPEARTLLARFERVRATLSGAANVAETVFRGELIGRDGEFGSIDTEAGTVRALLSDAAPSGTTGDAESEASDDARRIEVGIRVQVSVRADTVTLHDPAAAPEGGATSARNRFDGTVARVDAGASVALVAIDIGAEDCLTALVTDESRDRLGLRADVDVVAAFKSTATRATPIER